ncbi:hypothetical protein [Erwinia sorbitola]|uniref:Uncharacterized protein n=1 Tax=Erwinia sorbitola TaxID=2681984 RepID=A0ABW9RAA2_9GAMM|nr:hypothetical protein [Erwinia sorbitola]MTD26922.1 hypothetical protein [Erwinia sorbitola]
MSQFVIFNASKSAIHISVNQGDYFIVPAASQPSWIPAQPQAEPDFINKTVAGPGQLHLGDNSITIYPDTSGPADSGVCTLKISTEIPINSLQLYLFWKSATSVALVALQDGQPFQASIVTHDITSVTTSTSPALPGAARSAVLLQTGHQVQINM